MKKKHLLLVGPNGIGKSSIVDSIFAALYGRWISPKLRGSLHAMVTRETGRWQLAAPGEDSIDDLLDVLLD